MKIAILTTDNREPYRQYDKPDPWFGTAPEALLQGFAQLSEAEVHVVSCTQQPMVSSPAKLADNIFFHSLHVPKIGWMRTLYQGCVRATRKLLRELKPDIVHGQGTERECSLGAIFSGLPNVVTIHGNMAELARLFRAPVGSYHWLAARLENFTLGRTAGVFCNSFYTEGLVRSRAKKTWLVPNALRCEFFDPAPETSTALRHPIILNVGAICERKRQLELLDVAQKLHRQDVKLEWCFIGRLDPALAYAAEFHRRIHSLAAEGWVRHLGEMTTSKLIHHFDSAGGLVHFSSEEAFGLVVAEALARGLNFFGARIGGIADVAEGVPGAALFAGNDFDGLAAGLTSWAAQGRPLAKGAASLMRERYHPVIIARRHLEIYREVLAAHS
jgi:glycosyltransferase involved in cell wall biosynthesis